MHNSGQKFTCGGILMKMKKFKLFLTSWVVSQIIAFTLIIGLAEANMTQEEGARIRWFLISVVVLAGFLGGIITLLLSYYPELKRLRMEVGYMSRWMRTSPQEEADAHLAGHAALIQKLCDQLQVLAEKGTSGLNMSYTRGKSKDQLPDVLKKAIKRAEDEIQSSIEQFNTGYDHLSLFAKEAGITLRYRDWKQYLPASEKERRTGTND